MRKFLVIGVIAAVAIAGAVGSIFAQDSGAASDAAWLGIAVIESGDQVVIARVQPGSPADAADLLIGDAIISLNDTAIATASDLREQVQAAAPGDTVTLDVLRNSESLSVDVTLGSAPTAILGSRFGRGFALPTDALSAAEHLLHAELEETEAGFEVVSVFARRNPLDLQEGDVVTSINGQAVNELNLETLMTDLAALETPALTVVVTRDGAEVTLNSEVFGGRFGFGPGDRPGRGFGPGDGSRRGFGFGNTLPETPEDAAPAPMSGGQV
jgi:membrane-associated protease RseP (regulator of RpoE activity)